MKKPKKTSTYLFSRHEKQFIALFKAMMEVVTMKAAEEVYKIQFQLGTGFRLVYKDRHQCARFVECCWEKLKLKSDDPRLRVGRRKIGIIQEI